MNSPADAPVLSVSHFQKRYGDTIAVRDLSLTVEPGDIYGFIGHNGAGKTTLIRSIVGVQPIDGGSISVAGIDVTADPVAAKRLCAYVPDNPDVYDFMDGPAVPRVHRRHLRGPPSATARRASRSTRAASSSRTRSRAPSPATATACGRSSSSSARSSTSPGSSCSTSRSSAWTRSSRTSSSACSTSSRRAAARCSSRRTCSK